MVSIVINNDNIVVWLKLAQALFGGILGGWGWACPGLDNRASVEEGKHDGEEREGRGWMGEMEVFWDDGDGHPWAFPQSMGRADW